MNIKSKEIVLKYLVDICNQSGNDYFKSTHEIYEHFKEMKFFEKIVISLKDDSLLRINISECRISSIEVTDKGMLYFDEQKRTKIEYWKKFAMSHIVNLFVSAIVAFVTVLITLWLK